MIELKDTFSLMKRKGSMLKMNKGEVYPFLASIGVF